MRKTKKICKKCHGTGSVVSIWSGHRVPCSCQAGKEYERVGDFEEPDEQPRDWGDL